MKESIGERLARLRTERGLSQRDLQSEGVSYAYISRIENGQRQPSVKALRKLAVKLGVTPEYLETGKRMPNLEDRQGWIAWFTKTAAGREIVSTLDRERQFVGAIVWEAIYEEFGREQRSRAS
jgi:transcriptional regulator with XRE-family HTH domain